MNSDGKKISFGFSKLSKKPSVIPPPPKSNQTVELIDCLEGAEIKVKNAVEKVDSSPMVIPMKGGANKIVSQIEHGILKSKGSKTEMNEEDSRPDSELTIEELAARQLLKEARNRLEQEKDTAKVNTLVITGNSTVQCGLEPSIDDYENVPIEDIGLALLRGMARNEEISNNSKFVAPYVRPKGMGLGGQKIVDGKTEDVFDKNGKQLVLKEGAFAKIVAGPHKGKFCQVEFCDQWTGRVSVKTSKTNENLILNELFLVPIMKKDYVIGSKVINNAKYEQYKEIEENEDLSNKNKFTDRVQGSIASSEGIYRSKFDDFHLKNNEGSSRHSESQIDRDKVKVEYDSSDEEVSIKKEASSYKHESKKDKYEWVKSEMKTENYRSRESSEEHIKRKTDHKERTSVTEHRRNKSRNLPVSNDKKKSRIRSRSSSSEDYKRHNSKSGNGNRSGSSSSEYEKKISYKDNKHYRTKKHSEKYSSRYSDDYVRKQTEKHRQRNYSEDESSYEGKEECRSKKNKKSRRKRYSSPDSNHGNKK